MNELPLRDIHLPDAVSWWPPAPGWWILLALLIALIVFLPRLIKRLGQQPLNKTALIELEQIQQNFSSHKDELKLIQDISVLLRRVCISYLPREQAAGLTGEQWIFRLNSLSGKSFFTEQMGDLLISAPYKKTVEINSKELLSICKNWIEALPRYRQEPST